MGGDTSFHEIVVDHKRKQVKFEYPFAKRDANILRISGVAFGISVIFWSGVAFVAKFDIISILLGVGLLMVVVRFILLQKYRALSTKYKSKDTAIKWVCDPALWKEYCLKPEHIKSKVVEIHNVGNVFTQYYADGDFKTLMEKFEIRLEPFRKTIRNFRVIGDEIVKNERWLFRLTFSDVPKTGFILIQNQKDCVRID